MDRARVWRACPGSYCTVLQALADFPQQPILADRYHDRFERVAGRRRWADHLIFLDLFGDTGRHVAGTPGSD